MQPATIKNVAKQKGYSDGLEESTRVVRKRRAYKNQCTDYVVIFASV